MHFGLLSASGENDDFRPSDLVDIESGDSENEVLAQFKPIKNDD